MSLKYNKPFAVIIRDMNSNKLTFLLEQFNLSSQIATTPEKLKSILSSEIDYKIVNDKIITEQESTLNYLNQELI